MNASTQASAFPDHPGLPADVVDLAAEVLRTLADPTRLRLAALLADRELSVGELAQALQRPVPGVSQHLAKLRMARMVSTRKQGNSVRYRVANDHVRQLLLDTIGHVEHLLEDVPAHHRPVQETR